MQRLRLGTFRPRRQAKYVLGPNGTWTIQPGFSMFPDGRVSIAPSMLKLLSIRFDNKSSLILA